MKFPNEIHVVIHTYDDTRVCIRPNPDCDDPSYLMIVTQEWDSEHKMWKDASGQIYFEYEHIDNIINALTVHKQNVEKGLGREP